MDTIPRAFKSYNNEYKIIKVTTEYYKGSIAFQQSGTLAIVPKNKIFYSIEKDNSNAIFELTESQIGIGEKQIIATSQSSSTRVEYIIFNGENENSTRKPKREHSYSFDI